MHLCCSNLRVPTAIVYSEESFTPFLYAIINKYGNVVFSKKDEVPIWVMMIQHLISDPSMRLSPATDDAFLEQRLHPYTRFDLSELRTREMGVLVGMAMDLTTEQISVKLACSTNTVYSYRYNLKQKLGLATKFELAEFLSEIGLNPPRSEIHLPLDNK
jgi:DNA-binding CsgD family transcriptional regulator